ncbi:MULTISPECIES: TaqI-like C-terminal specificity domain-containing protein [unclassified Chryseobacterium]|uniref:TaqI-like C-terminal specificity domain-containing protein n=1 Tax=unclassified Chryseobacterium TaxID=2593645 RepID=UPI0009E7ABC0|nr:MULTISPECIES: TaqI-like C-terminal specificity domain-containing protein [unclassified Chryseobacterium]
MSDYFRQTSVKTIFSSSHSWVILGEVEQRIKAKIEAVGTPLKEWDINIYRGILTGYNEAFIIDRKKKDELIAKDPKSVEIIRPLLRGRDIKRYSFDFADLYILTTFPSLNVDIDSFPAVKEHLLSFGYDRLKQTGDQGARKKTNNKWFETQDSISYWEDFSIQKIMYPNMTKFLPFYLDDKGFMQNDKSFMITGTHLSYLTAFLNSSLFKYCFIDNFPELQGGTREIRKIFLDKIPVLKVDDQLNYQFEKLVSQIQSSKRVGNRELELNIDQMIFDLYDLSVDERNEIGFIEIQ